KKEVNNDEPIIKLKSSFNFDILKNKNIFGNFLSFFKKKKAVDNLDLLETNLIKDEIEIVYDWKKDLSIFFVLLRSQEIAPNCLDDFLENLITTTFFLGISLK
ncbi:MAG TPA: hypothetical protein PKU95_02985, partial [Candidatus Dojkabacteria bacterium]|nr:hypothetical protein [Candidatus Dojkabacteria bacterium]